MNKFKHSVKSFAEVMAIIDHGFVPPAKEKKQKTCRRCGSSMEQVTGTNVWRCAGDKLEDGKTCANTIFDRVYSVA